MRRRNRKLHNVVTVLNEIGCSYLMEHANPEDAVLRLGSIYDEETRRIADAARRLSAGKSESVEVVHGFYPIVAAQVTADEMGKLPNTAYGFARRGPGVYVGTITRPDIFAPYLIEQLQLFQKNHGCKFYTAVGAEPIPALYALEAINAPVPPLPPGFTRPSAVEIAESNDFGDLHGVFPFGYLSGLQIDERMSLLWHWTGTRPECFQPFVVVANYSMYMRLFREYAASEIAAGRAERMVCSPPVCEESEREAPQMDTCHLIRADGLGITMINMGVGSPNALTIGQALAAFRCHVAAFLGHVGAVQPNIPVGRFIIGNSYLRLDGITVVEGLIPIEQPVPIIGELNRLLHEAGLEILGVEDNSEAAKDALQNGTIATVSNRFWHLFKPTRNAVMTYGTAVDMEAAVFAATFTRLAVTPCCVFTMVTDRPLHHEPKSRNLAKETYTRRKKLHFLIGLRAIELARLDPLRFHSRQLRGPEDPPWR